MDLGLYGTLLDLDVRALVLGENWRNAGQAAVLCGWERLYVQGVVYPGIRLAPDSAIDVWILRDVDPQAVANANAFEGDEYDLQRLPVTYSGTWTAEDTAMFYVPTPSAILSGKV